MKNKLKIEILAAVASVFTGLLLGEGNLIRNLISGTVAAIVSVVIIELIYHQKKKQSK